MDNFDDIQNQIEETNKKIEGMVNNKLLKLLEKNKNVDQFEVSKHQRKKEQKRVQKLIEEQKADRVTDEDRRNWAAINSRSAISLDRFYKKDKLSQKRDIKDVQFGVYVNDAEDFYSNRNKKASKKSFVQQLMEDEKVRSTVRRKYNSVIARDKKRLVKVANKRYKTRKNKKR